MKAAWDWQLAAETGSDLRERLELARDCGFDTVIVPDVTPSMADYAADLGLEAVAIVGMYVSETFRENHPEALQRIHPVEEAILDCLDEGAIEDYQRLSHRRYPIVHDTETFCFEHSASVEALEERIARALTTADGVAFDGIGFRNRYACFCDRCRAVRANRATQGEDRAAVRARLSERTLVEISEKLYRHVKSIDPDAIVTNHLWPPFRPNPYYGHRLKLDYCSQTIAWFYRPSWSLERVEFEARRHRDLETPARNTFVPFVGLFDDPYLRRSPERVARELDIARRYGDGNLVFATLDPLEANDDIRVIVRDALT